MFTVSKQRQKSWHILLYHTLFYSILFYSILFYSTIMLVYRIFLFQALDEAAKSVKAAFDAAEKELADARQSIINAKEDCKRKMSLKCDNCKNLKCKEAERNCKGFLDAAGKWISKNVLAPVCVLTNF